METIRKNWQLGLTVVCVAVGLWALCLVSGCKSGPSPYVWDRTTNLVSEVVVYKTNTVLDTNWVTQVKTFTNTVFDPNGGPPQVQVVVTPIRNGVVTSREEIVLQTNRDYNVTYTVSTNAAGLAHAAGNITNLFLPGSGDLVAKGLLGGLALVGGLFARKYKQEGNQIQAVADTHKELADKTAGALSQVIQTYREVAQTTPQGALVDAQLKSWMQSHQQANGVLDLVSDVVANHVDDAAAQALARQVIAEAQRLSGPNPKV